MRALAGEEEGVGGDGCFCTPPEYAGGDGRLHDSCRHMPLVKLVRRGLSVDAPVALLSMHNSNHWVVTRHPSFRGAKEQYISHSNSFGSSIASPNVFVTKHRIAAISNVGPTCRFSFVVLREG